MPPDVANIHDAVGTAWAMKVGQVPATMESWEESLAEAMESYHTKFAEEFEYHDVAGTTWVKNGWELDEPGYHDAVGTAWVKLQAEPKTPAVKDNMDKIHEENASYEVHSRPREVAGGAEDPDKAKVRKCSEQLGRTRNRLIAEGTQNDDVTLRATAEKVDCVRSAEKYACFAEGEGERREERERERVRKEASETAERRARRVGKAAATRVAMKAMKAKAAEKTALRVSLLVEELGESDMNMQGKGADVRYRDVVVHGEAVLHLLLLVYIYVHIYIQDD